MKRNSLTRMPASRAEKEHGICGWLLESPSAEEPYYKAAFGNKVIAIPAADVIRASNEPEVPLVRCVVICEDDRSASQRFIDRLAGRDPDVRLRVYTEASLLNAPDRRRWDAFFREPGQAARKLYDILDPTKNSSRVRHLYRGYEGTVLSCEQYGSTKYYRIAIRDDVICVAAHAVGCLSSEPYGTKCRLNESGNMFCTDGFVHKAYNLDTKAAAQYAEFLAECRPAAGMPSSRRRTAPSRALSERTI